MPAPIFTVEKSEVIYDSQLNGKKQGIFRRIASKPNNPYFFGYSAYADLGEKLKFNICCRGEGDQKIDSLEHLAKSMFKLASKYDILQAPNLLDPKERVLDGSAGVIYGIALDTNELREVMRHYIKARGEYYDSKKPKSKK